MILVILLSFVAKSALGEVCVAGPGVRLGRRPLGCLSLDIGTLLLSAPMIVVIAAIRFAYA
jgi:hypothetical protein